MEKERKEDKVPEVSSAFMYTLNVGEMEEVPELIKEFFRSSIAENAAARGVAQDQQAKVYGRLNIRLSHFYNRNDSLPEIQLSPIRVSLADIPVPGIFVHSSTPAYMILYSIAGHGAVYYREERYNLRKNEGMILDCKNIQQYFADPQVGWECIFVRVDGAFARRIYERALTLGKFKFSFFDSGHFQALLKELLHPVESPYADTTAHAVLILAELLSEIALELSRQENRLRDVPPYIDEVRQYLEQHMAEEVNLDTLASTFSFSKYHLSREFKKYMGRPPIDYLLECRLNCAKKLLVNTKRSIADISRAVGIENANYFFTLFNKKEGMSPSAFRKQFFEHQAKPLN